MTAVLQTDDIAVGEQAEVATVPGTLQKIRVTGAAATGGVASVTASAPLTSTGGVNPNIALSVPLTVPEGGTGLVTATDHGVLVGQGAAAMAVTSPGVAGQVLTSNGPAADPTFQPAAAGGVASVTASAPLTSTGGANPNIALTTPLPVADGGTGDTTFTAHGVLVGEGAGAIAATGTGTAGQVLTSNGGAADPSFQTLPASVTSVTATAPLASTGGATPNLSITTPLPVADGGTGDTSLTAHGVLIGAGTGAVAPTTPGTVGQVLTSNGGAADPTFQTLPTSVASVTATAPITSTGGINPVIALTQSTWQSVAAGATQAVAAQHLAQFFAVDTTTGSVPSDFTFPPHGTAIDGQEVTITLEGATISAPVDLDPGTNNIMGDPKNAGTYGASGQVLTAQQSGQVVRRKYKDDGVSGRWRPF